MKKIIIRFNAPVILSFALLSLIALLLGNWTNGAATTQYFPCTGPLWPTL